MCTKGESGSSHGREQPCWTCERAYGGCPWSQSFSPVPGWIASPTLVNGVYPSYRITYCPLYTGDKPRLQGIEARVVRLDACGFTKEQIRLLTGVTVRETGEILERWENDDS